jgi:hypothetical protein
MRSGDVALDKDGRFELAGLESRYWKVTCTARGFEPASTTVFVPDDDRQRTVDFELVPTTPHLVFIVHLRTPEGHSLREPIGKGAGIDPSLTLGVICVASRPTRGSKLPTDARFFACRATALDPGDEARKDLQPEADDAWFRVDLPSRESGWCCVLRDEVVLDTASFGAVTSRVDLVVPLDGLPRATGGLRVHVVDDRTGAAVPYALARVHDAAATDGGWIADEKGKLVIDRIAAGSAELDVWSTAFQVSNLHAVVQPGAEIDVGTVRLKPK